MAIESLQARMLGCFSLQSGQQEINDQDNRTKKVWLLLAYMIYYRSRPLSQAELADLLWGEEERSTNPFNALKTMLHRVRTSLDRLDPSAGHTLILRRDGSYAWNTEIPFQLDVEQFEQACHAGDAAQDEEERLNCYLQALSLYRGDFLQKLSSESWVVPIAAYYHNLYIQTLLETLPLLEERGGAEQAIELCRHAVTVEPYNELVYQHLMRNLLTLQQHRDVITAYDEMSQLLFDNFGVLPSEESRALYRQAVRTVNDRTMSIGAVLEQLRESEGNDGALFCEYDFFKIIYHAAARSVVRSGDAVHICLISAAANQGQELSKRSLTRCMENLKELICSNLRRGDVASLCSASQYILMLPQANYENSCMICERILKSFTRQYPHSPAHLHYAVQPLEPSV
jgi:DNA-binding SARP family transcriptional activator